MGDRESICFRVVFAHLPSKRKLFKLRAQKLGYVRILERCSWVYDVELFPVSDLQHCHAVLWPQFQCVGHKDSPADSGRGHPWFR